MFTYSHLNTLMNERRVVAQLFYKLTLEHGYAIRITGLLSRIELHDTNFSCTFLFIDWCSTWANVIL